MSDGICSYLGVTSSLYAAEKLPGMKTNMPACAGATTNKNQLLRVCDTPAADAYIRNPGYRLTYSCMLTRPMSVRLCEQARPSTQPLSGIFTVTDTNNEGIK